MEKPYDTVRLEPLFDLVEQYNRDLCRRKDLQTGCHQPRRSESERAEWHAVTIMQSNRAATDADRANWA